MKATLALFLIMVSPLAWSVMELPEDTHRPPTSAVARAAVPARPPVEEPGLTVELKDGSRIIGRFAAKNVALTITNDAIGAMRIPFEKIRALQLDKDAPKAAATLQNGDTLRGTVTLDALKLTTVFGNITVPIAQIARINLATGGAAAGPQLEGLVLAYSFDTDEGDRVTDKSGKDHHGRVQGAKYVAQGKQSGAMQFGEPNTGIVVGNPTDLQLQDLTIMAWIKTDNLARPSPDNPSMAALFAYGRGGYIFYLCNDGRIGLSKVGVDIIVSQSAISVGKYHHVAVTRKGATTIFYIDGVADPEGEYGSQFVFRTNAAVGAVGDDLSCSFRGEMDDLKIFNRPLTAEEVRSLQNASK